MNYHDQLPPHVFLSKCPVIPCQLFVASEGCANFWQFRLTLLHGHTGSFSYYYTDDLLTYRQIFLIFSPSTDKLPNDVRGVIHHLFMWKFLLGRCGGRLDVGEAS